MDTYRQRLGSLLGALRIVPPDRFCWYGKWSPPPSKAVAESIDEATRRSYLLAQLRSLLYERFYLHGRAISTVQPNRLSAILDESSFVRALEEANQGSGSWQSGWRVISQGEGGVWAKRNELTLWVSDTEYQEAPDELNRSSGIAVRLPKGFRVQSPGFYLAQGDVPARSTPGEVLVRLYWHINPAGATKLMSRITSKLNAEEVPFQFKVVNDPDAYHRNDAAVLYLAKPDLLQVAPQLSDIYRDVQSNLMPGWPALTRQLRPGLSLAEDPGSGESFGTHRCGLLAEALIEAAERAITRPDDVLRLIEEHFHRERLELARPYLGPSSDDDYDDLLDIARWYVADTGHATVGVTVARQADPVTHPGDGGRFLGAAISIGDRLVDSAVWHAGRCTWLGELTSADSGRGTDFGAIGPELYAGTSGVALFLAQLYASTGIERFASTAQGAVRQAIRKLMSSPEPLERGYYTGWPGVAVAAALIGRLTGDDELRQNAPLRLFDLLSDAPCSPNPDLLSGTAGAVLAFLDLARLSGDERCLNRAVELGDEIIATAKGRGASRWWPVDAGSGRRGLTGFAHGAAGIATAMLALYSTTSDGRFRLAAEGAIAFERRNFSPSLGNWLDLRYPAAGSRFGPGAIAMDAWCHGSSGILISRLLAWQLLQDDCYLEEAKLAVQSMLRWLGTEPSSSPTRWSLCHGFAGNADILLWASELLPDDSGHLGRLARNVGDAGLAIDQSTMEPGLMLGVAGLGSFYLRLANPAVPSPLIPWNIDPAPRG